MKADKNAPKDGEEMGQQELSREEMAKVKGGWSRWSLSKKETVESSFTATAFGDLDDDPTYSDFSGSGERTLDGGTGELDPNI